MIGTPCQDVVRGNHAMFFVGKEKGFFAQNGIEVTDIHRDGKVYDV